MHRRKPTVDFVYYLDAEMKKDHLLLELSSYLAANLINVKGKGKTVLYNIL